jgi:hypothetical protein
MKVIIDRLWHEPAFLGGVLVAVVGFVVALGFDADGPVVASVTGLIAILTGVGVRKRVTPTE